MKIAVMMDDGRVVDAWPLAEVQEAAWELMGTPVVQDGPAAEMLENELALLGAEDDGPDEGDGPDWGGK